MKKILKNLFDEQALRKALNSLFTRISNPYKRFSCRMGWHSYPNFDHVHTSYQDPLNFLTFAQCKWCKYKGQIDSQGNLF